MSAGARRCRRRLVLLLLRRRRRRPRRAAADARLNGDARPAQRRVRSLARPRARPAAAARRAEAHGTSFRRPSSAVRRRRRCCHRRRAARRRRRAAVGSRRSHLLDLKTGGARTPPPVYASHVVPLIPYASPPLQVTTDGHWPPPSTTTATTSPSSALRCRARRSCHSRHPSHISRRTPSPYERCMVNVGLGSTGPGRRGRRRPIAPLVDGTKGGAPSPRRHAATRPPARPPPAPPPPHHRRASRAPSASRLSQAVAGASLDNILSAVAPEQDNAEALIDELNDEPRRRRLHPPPLRVPPAAPLTVRPTDLSTASPHDRGPPPGSSGRRARRPTMTDGRDAALDSHAEGRRRRRRPLAAAGHRQPTGGGSEQERDERRRRRGRTEVVVAYRRARGGSGGEGVRRRSDRRSPPVFYDADPRDGGAGLYGGGSRWPSPRAGTTAPHSPSPRVARRRLLGVCLPTPRRWVLAPIAASHSHASPTSGLIAHFLDTPPPPPLSPPPSSDAAARAAVTAPVTSRSF